MPKPPEPKPPGLLGVWEHFTLADGLPDLKMKHPAGLRCLRLGCAFFCSILLLAGPGEAQISFTKWSDSQIR